MYNILFLSTDEYDRCYCFIYRFMACNLVF